MYNDDESTDDEYGMNYLAERLSINKGENSNFVEDKFENSKDFKQYCNMRRKKFAQEGQSSSSSSIEVPNDNPTSALAWYVIKTCYKIIYIYIYRNWILMS